ncbi:hypothetical protein [Microbispora bryophytorum]|uniref:hypothetical protein n=1 Tax=Microbispora bryophytorum TaxID=1460882 RepID=UPI0033FA8A91
MLVALVAAFVVAGLSILALIVLTNPQENAPAALGAARTRALQALIATYVMLFTVSGLAIELRYRRRLEHVAEDPSERIRRRIRAVNTAFADAVTLMQELQRDFEAQQLLREKLQAEADHQQRLLELSREEAEEIGRLMTSETKASVRAERRRAWMFFALSVAASVPVGVWVNHIS